MELNISTYYYKNIEKQSEDKMIAEKIEEYIELIPESGYRPVTVYLNKSMLINHKKVSRIMGEYNLLCIKKKKYQSKTTDSRHPYKKYKNIAKDFETTDINQVIVGDPICQDSCRL
jgi:putative transposase